MNIKDAKALTGISEQMIRFYEKKNIIHPQRNEENNYRTYTNHDIFLMVMARSYNSLGIPLDEVLQYINLTDINDISTKLESKISELENQEIWLKEKIKYTKDISSIFQSIKEKKKYDVIHFDELYFYPNSSQTSEKYPDIFKMIGVSRTVLRVENNIIFQDNYPNDIGVLLTRNVPSLSITPISYNDVTLFRFYKTTPVAEVITPKEVQKLAKSINKLGYQIISDCFIYQVAENHTEEENDFICVEFIVKQN